MQQIGILLWECTNVMVCGAIYAKVFQGKQSFFIAWPFLSLFSIAAFPFFAAIQLTNDSHFIFDINILATVPIYLFFGILAGIILIITYCILEKYIEAKK